MKANPFLHPDLRMSKVPSGNSVRKNPSLYGPVVFLQGNFPTVFREERHTADLKRSTATFRKDLKPEGGEVT